MIGFLQELIQYPVEAFDSSFDFSFKETHWTHLH